MTEQNERVKRTRGRTVAPRRSSWPWVAGLVLLVVLGIAAWYFTRDTSVTPVDPGGEIAELETFQVETSHETGDLTYPQIPPAGGPHNPTWMNCGIYNEPIPDEFAVHSLEHGAVWVTYQPELPPEQVEKLKSLARGQRFVLLSPYPGLPKPVVASAWSLQVKVDSADDPRISQFIARYQQGQQAPESGAACTGGTGLPTG